MIKCLAMCFVSAKLFSTWYVRLALENFKEKRKRMHVIKGIDCISTPTGPPLPPGVNSTLHNVTTILVEWDEPFTWSGHSVLSYIVTELITGEVVGNTTYDATDTSHTYSSPTGGVAETCQLVSFEVAAVSDVGTGEAGVATGGLPIGQFTKHNFGSELIDPVAAKLSSKEHGFRVSVGLSSLT